MCGLTARNILLIPLAAATLSILGGTARVQAQNTTPYEADLNKNQLVDFPDLAALGNQWGQTGSGLEADLNDDQAVNAADLGALASVWLNPWTPINTIQDVNDLMRENPAGCYALISDVNASETATWNNGKGFEPLPEFTGYFNGQGHSIFGLYINRPSEENVGLFSILSGGAQVYNLNIENGYLECDIYGGVLAGTIGNATISQISASGTVSARNGQGGGIVGVIYKGTITDSISNCLVSGKYYLGGIAGETYSNDPTNLIIVNCLGEGNVTSTRRQAGGLVGRAYKTFILNSISTATVDGDDPTGGLVGENKDGTAIIDNSYFTDANHVNGQGTFEPGGEEAFYGTDHPVYDTWQFVDANGNGVWVPDVNDLPHLKGPAVYDTNEPSAKTLNTVTPIRLLEDEKAPENLTLVQRTAATFREAAKGILGRKEDKRYTA